MTTKSIGFGQTSTTIFTNEFVKLKSIRYEIQTYIPHRNQGDSRVDIHIKESLLLEKDGLN